MTTARAMTPLLLLSLGLILMACDGASSPFGGFEDDDGAGDDDDDSGPTDDDDTGGGDECDGVVCGTNAHCDDGDCVCDDGFAGDPYEACDEELTEEQRIRAELVEIAAAEVGYCEGVDDRPYMQYQPGYWCYDFVAWVYQQADEGLPAPISLPQMFIGSMPDGWRPQAGDLIKYNIQHYGMVASLSGDEVTVFTIEGNVNYCVMERSTTDADVEYYGTLEDFFSTF